MKFFIYLHFFTTRYTELKFNSGWKSPYKQSFKVNKSDFIHSVIAIHVFLKQFHFLRQPRILPIAWMFSLKVAWELLTQSTLSLSLIISVTWSINFRMVFLFYMSLNSVYLFSIQQLRALIGGKFQSNLLKPSDNMSLNSAWYLADA